MDPQKGSFCIPLSEDSLLDNPCGSSIEVELPPNVVVFLDGSGGKSQFLESFCSWSPATRVSAADQQWMLIYTNVSSC